MRRFVRAVRSASAPKRRSPGASGPVYLSALLSLIGLWGLPFSAAQAQATVTSARSGDENDTRIRLPDPDVQPAAFSASPRIRKFLVLGNRLLSQTAIVLASGHREGDPCTAKTMTEIKENLFKKGYFGMHSADLEQAVRVHSEPEADGQAKVVIEVDENEAVRNIAVSGSGPIKPEEIVGLLHIKPGTVYNPLQFRRDYVDIQDLYNHRGYTVTPSQEAGMNDKGDLHVALNVTRVTEIEVKNNRKTRSEVILREMKTKRGDFLNTQTLNADRLRLYNLELFDEVNFAPRDLGPGRVGLLITVKERQSGSINGGLSYSARDQLVGTMQIADTNFRGRHELLSLNGELGTDLKRKVLELEYGRPWIDRHATALDFRVFTRTTNRFSNSLTDSLASAITSGGSDQYTQQRYGGSFTLTRPLNDTTRAALTFRGETVQTNTLNLSAENARILQNGPILSLSGSLQRDTRDFIADPVKGNFQAFTLGVGYADIQPVQALASDAASVFGTTHFTKTSFEFRHYASLAGPRRRDRPDEEKTSFAIRLLAGSSLGKLPFSEQYFLGGAETLRGYRDDRFWGSNMMLGSMELRQPFARRFKGVLFVDVGEAWGGNYSNVSLSGFKQSGFLPHMGAGVGLRVGTPLGPVRIDYGVGDEGGRTHFSIGHSF